MEIDFYGTVKHAQRMYLTGKTSLSNFDRNIIFFRLDWVCLGEL